MHVYLVRHGETKLNRKHIHQYPSTPLSEKGRDEARTTAEALREMNADYIVSSDYERALETARIIGSHTGLTLEKSSLFVEIVRPSILYGRSHFIFGTFKYAILSVLKRKNKDWRYKDAENMNDLLERIGLSFKYLEKLNKKHKSIIVVTHSVYMNLLVAHACNPGPLSFFELTQAFLKVKFTKNASVVHLEYVGKQKGNMCAWEVY